MSKMTKSELWARMCNYEGIFTMAHAESVLKYFDCKECPNSGAECEGCPIKKAETTIINDLWQRAETTALQTR
jgi:hypothetical protein